MNQQHTKIQPAFWMYKGVKIWSAIVCLSLGVFSGAVPIAGKWPPARIVQAAGALSQGQLTLRYVDATGAEIHAPTPKLGTVSSAYAVVPENIAGDALLGGDDASAPLTGKFLVTGQTITMRDARSNQVVGPLQSGRLTVHFVDQRGATIRQDLVQAGPVGQGYDVRLELPGYRLSGTGQSAAPLSGRLGQTPIQITLIYLKLADLVVADARVGRALAASSAPPSGAEGSAPPGRSSEDAPVAAGGSGRLHDIAVLSGTDPFLQSQPPAGSSTDDARAQPLAEAAPASGLAVRPGGSPQPALTRRLPPTGEHAATGLTVAGLSLLSLVGLLIGWKPRRRQ